MILKSSQASSVPEVKSVLSMSQSNTTPQVSLQLMSKPLITALQTNCFCSKLSFEEGESVLQAAARNPAPFLLPTNEIAPKLIFSCDQCDGEATSYCNYTVILWL